MPKKSSPKKSAKKTTKNKNQKAPEAPKIRKPRKKPLIKGSPVVMEVKHQGAPMLESAHIIERGENIVCISIACKSKYVEPFASHGAGQDEPVGLSIYSNKNSLNLDTSQNKTHPTVIDFPQFINWDVVATGYDKSTITVCIIKK